jgi:hypothetical protein
MKPRIELDVGAAVDKKVGMHIRRIRHWLGTGLAVLSLVCCLATVALWIKSYSNVNTVSWATEKLGGATWFTRRSLLRNIRGTLEASIEWNAGSLPLFSTMEQRGSYFVDYLPVGQVHWKTYTLRQSAPNGRVTFMQKLGFEYNLEVLDRPNRIVREVHAKRYLLLGIPHWLAAILLGLWPGISMARWIGARGSRRESAGRCRQCGYDMRATPMRCPECGTVAREVAKT